MRVWSKLFLLLLLSFSKTYAISNCDNCLETIVKIGINRPDYQKEARKQALDSLSKKLFSQVSGTSVLISKYQRDDNNEYKKTNFNEQSNIKYNNPLIGVIEKDSYEKNYYVLKMVLDYKKSGPSYLKLAEFIAANVNDELKAIKTTEDIYKKKEILLKVKKQLAQFELYKRISLIMKYDVKNKPKINQSACEIQIIEINKDIYLGVPTRYKTYEINTKGIK